MKIEPSAPLWPAPAADRTARVRPDDGVMDLKLREVLPHVRPGLVIDVGSGSGAMLRTIREMLPGTTAVGLDFQPGYLAMALANAGLPLVRGDARNVPLRRGIADTVILSSALHEIFTFGGRGTDLADRVIADLASLLKPGGHFILRESVRAVRGKVLLELRDDDGLPDRSGAAPRELSTRGKFERFCHDYLPGDARRPRWRELVAGGRQLVEVDRALATEALQHMIQVDAWSVEVLEIYGVCTLQRYRSAMRRAGLSILTADAYLNPWIEEHCYQGRVRIWHMHSGATLVPEPYPASTFFGVGVKRP